MDSVGKRFPRVDARAKVLGTARYADDYVFPGMLHAKAVYSPHPHAEVVSIDPAPALALPGVRAVVTPRDIPGENLIPLVIPDLPVLAKRARYVGDPVAVVVADTQDLAAEGARLVRVEWRPLPAVFDPIEALAPGAPLVAPPHETPQNAGHGSATTGANLYNYLKVRKGDIQAGFDEADLIVEHTYRTPYHEHAYLEPQGMTVVPEPDGGVSVYGCMQCPFYVHEAVARILGLPRHLVRVFQVGTGGGFGGKEDVPSIIAGLAALGAHATKRPVKLVLSRKEDMETMSKRHPAIVRYKTGVKNDGTLTALEVELYLDGGGYATLSPVVLYRAVVHAAGPYRVPHVKIDGYAVATNKVPCGAFRGFGTLQVIFANESNLDEVAARLKMDPWEIRKRNALRAGDETATGQLLPESVGLLETLEKAAEKSDYFARRKTYASWQQGPKRRGLGVSCIFYGVGLGAKGKFLDKTAANIQVHPDASALVAIGNAEMGQGLRTVIGQIAAEELGLSFEKVQCLDGDTSRVPDSGPTVASRATVMAGNAVRDAAAKIRREMFQVAAPLLEAMPDDLYIEDQKIKVRSADPKRTARMLAVREVVRRCHDERREMTATGFRLPADTWWDDEKGQGKAYEVFSFATNVCELEVDIETGETRVLRLVAAHDIGKAINPALAEGQIEGGSLQGLGFALTEEVKIENGFVKNPRFATYIIPTAMDSPEIVSVIVEHSYSSGPYGAKGIGEPPIMGIAPAVTNAIKEATGARMFEVPATPERVRDAIRRATGKKEETQPTRRPAVVSEGRAP
ncbi:xanthine dehydrogenase family protein [bacterium]|nr:xanthine dehydrogenase family protein [bacterium]